MWLVEFVCNNLQKCVQKCKISLICTFAKCVHAWPLELFYKNCKNVGKSVNVQNFAHFAYTRTHAKRVRCASRCGHLCFFEKIAKMCTKVRMCEISHVRTRTCEMCAMCVQVWWAEIFWNFFEKMCAKVRTCEISHIRTRAKCV